MEKRASLGNAGRSGVQRHGTKEIKESLEKGGEVGEEQWGQGGDRKRQEA